MPWNTFKAVLTFSAGTGNCRSSPVTEALQGSPLGPFWFSCKMLHLGHLGKWHNHTFDSYADDTAVSSEPSNKSSLETVLHSLHDLPKWMLQLLEEMQMRKWGNISLSETTLLANKLSKTSLVWKNALPGSISAKFHALTASPAILKISWNRSKCLCFWIKDLNNVPMIYPCNFMIPSAPSSVNTFVCQILYDEIPTAHCVLC